VPMREISQSDTPAAMGAEKNPSICVYDCSGPYTDPQAKIDIRKGPPCASSGSRSAATARSCRSFPPPTAAAARPTRRSPRCAST
jgi:hypothetical protein